MQNDAIIFDIDGTLWNACPATAKAWNIGLNKLGIDKYITPEQVESVTGNPNETCIDLLLPRLKNKYPSLLATLEKYEMEVIKSEGGKFYDGVLEGIKELASDYRLFLVSNCQSWYLDLFLKLSGLKPYIAGFDCHGTSGKPKNEMLSNIKSNYFLNNPVYIGDTAGDENAAYLANIDFIHVLYGFGSSKKESRKFNSFAALLDYFRERKNNI
jgi:phosphoglycolate phosphatase